jgi:hypothetical protein
MADTYTVERTTTIDAPADEVYAQIVDFHNWRNWSPWDDIDPDLQRSYSGPDSGVGAGYSWSGNRKAGEGTMEITIGTEARMVRPGDVIVFPPDVPHAGKTFDQSCRLIDVFAPPRTGIREVIAGADAVRSADVDRWWQPES